MIENQAIKIKEELKWSEWFDWNDLLNDKIEVPICSGVYEVRIEDYKECLDIGKAANLRNRMLIRLIKGKYKHSTRDRMKKANVNFNSLKVRWAETKYPAAVEEYLHNLHKTEFGTLPTYVKKT